MIVTSQPELDRGGRHLGADEAGADHRDLGAGRQRCPEPVGVVERAQHDARPSKPGSVRGVAPVAMTRPS